MAILIQDSSTFSEHFLTKFLENGFGALPKRELEVYLLYLFLEDGQFKNESAEIDYHEMSLALRISETKVRNLVYEIELKYAPPETFAQSLIDLIEQNRFEVDTVKKLIKFSVQRPLLKQAFEYEVRKLGGVSDGSFSKQIVTIKQDTFAKLLNRLYGDKVHDEMLNRVQCEIELGAVAQNERTGLLRLFAEEFIKTSGGKSAEMLFDNLNPVEWLKSLQRRTIETETPNE